MECKKFLIKFLSVVYEAASGALHPVLDSPAQAGAMD